MKIIPLTRPTLYLKRGLCALAMLTLPLMAQAQDTEKVLGVYNTNLTYYDENGKKLGRFENVKESEIKGIPVLGTSPRKLKHIQFRNTDAWVRASQLKLSVNTTDVCPDMAPGHAADRATPVSSGMGGECIKKESLK